MEVNNAIFASLDSTESERTVEIGQNVTCCNKIVDDQLANTQGLRAKHPCFGSQKDQTIQRVYHRPTNLLVSIPA